MIRAALCAERRRHAHARATIRTSAPRTKVQECPPSFDAAGCVIAATSRDACSASCWRPCEEPADDRVSRPSAGDGRCRGAALTPCRCVPCTETRGRVTSAAPSETEGPGSSSTRGCEVGRVSATAPAADGSRLALTGAATGAEAAGDPATLSAGALLAVTVVVAATSGFAAGASAVEATPTTAVTAGASPTVAGGAPVRDGRNTIGSTYPC